jgi:hypothetical protein
MEEPEMLPVLSAQNDTTNLRAISYAGKTSETRSCNSVISQQIGHQQPAVAEHSPN